jgi:hypothetical protein
MACIFDNQPDLVSSGKVDCSLYVAYGADVYDINRIASLLLSVTLIEQMVTSDT